MKRIIALLAIVAMSFSAKAGNVTIDNPTANTLTIQSLMIGVLSPGGTIMYNFATPVTILPFTSITYTSVDDLITTLSGVPSTSFPASSHFLASMLVNNVTTGCSIGGMGAPGSGSACGISFNMFFSGPLRNYTVNFF